MLPVPSTARDRPSFEGIPITVIAGYSFVALSAIALTIVLRTRPLLIIEAPATALLAGALTLAVTAACLGQWTIHHLFRERDFVRHNEVAGFIVAVCGTLYAVMLGFLTVVTWQHFSDAGQVVASEAAAAADAWHMAVSLPSEERSKVRRDVLAYSELMIVHEWPAMRRGDYEKGADVIVMDAIGAAGMFKPADLSQANGQSATLAQLGVLHDLRQKRISQNAAGIVPFEWLVLLIGGASVVAFCWIFGVTNRQAHMLMTSCVVVIVTSLLVLLFELQYPFRTSLGIAPDPWLAVIQHIRVMQSGAQMEMRM